MISVFTTLVKEARENETIRCMYAKKNCKCCYGLGKVTISNRIGSTFVEKIHLCDCVIKAIKRELNSGKDTKKSRQKDKKKS